MSGLLTLNTTRSSLSISFCFSSRICNGHKSKSSTSKWKSLRNNQSFNNSFNEGNRKSICLFLTLICVYNMHPIKVVITPISWIGLRGSSNNTNPPNKVRESFNCPSTLYANGDVFPMIQYEVKFTKNATTPLKQNNKYRCYIVACFVFLISSLCQPKFHLNSKRYSIWITIEMDAVYWMNSFTCEKDHEEVKKWPLTIEMFNRWLEQQNSHE